MLPNVSPIAIEVEPEVTTPAKEAPSLLSKKFDAAMAGGASLIAFGVCMLFFDRAALPFQYVGVFPNDSIFRSPTITAISWTMFYLSST